MSRPDQPSDRIVWVCDGCGHMAVDRKGHPCEPADDEMLQRAGVIACCPERKMIKHRLVRAE